MSEIEELYQACRRGNKDLALSILTTNRHFLLYHDWDSTPLHEACRHGWLDVVRLCIEKHDYNLNKREKLSRQTPLHYCCRYGRIDIVIYLNERGCNPFLRDIEGKEPLDYALENDHTNIVCYLCHHCISSAMMLATDRLETTVNVLEKMHQDNLHHHDWKTSNDDNIIEIVCHSKLIATDMSSKDIMKLLNNIHATINLNVRDVIPHLICRDQSSVSYVPSGVMLEWMKDTTLDPMKLVISCNWKTVDGDTILQLVCQSESFLIRMSSPVMLKCLTDNTLSDNLMDFIVPNWKTADGDTLLQLVCQSELCISRISSITMKNWLKCTKVDLLMVGPDWKTADDVTIIEVIQQLKSQQLNFPILTNLIITHHWPGNEPEMLQVLFQHELYISQVQSINMLKWLHKTNLDLERVVVPHWKTADGDTLLQLVSQSMSCVSRISSTEMLKWLTDTTFDLTTLIVPNWNTADGDTLLELVCQSDSCVSRISSELVLNWLTDNPLDLVEPNYKTADGSTLLQLVCKSKSCVSHISSITMEKWLTNTSDDLLIAGPNWKTADGITITEITRQLESEPLVHLSGDTPSDIIISRHWPGKDFKIVFYSEFYVSHVSSLNMLLWLKNTTLDLERIVIPNWKTADGDSLLQLVCQSESCVSHLSSKKIVALLRKTNVDLIISGLSWKTSDGVTMLRTLTKLQPRNLSTNPIDVIITPHWGTVVGKTFLQVLYKSKDYFSSIVSTTSLLIWFQKTTLDLERIVVPHWKTADDVTLLELICQSGSCVSRISSIVMLKWLSDTPLDLSKSVVPNYITADGDTLLQLVLKSELCVSRISSTAMLKWLTDTPLDLMKLIVPNYKTTDGDTLFQLVCQSESCVSHTSSMTMEKWLTNTSDDLLIAGPNWKTADGITMTEITHQLESESLERLSDDTPYDIIIFRHWPGKDFKIVFYSEFYVSHVSSLNMLVLLENTTLDLERMVIPNWKTADGDSLLQLVCQSESCVSHLSSKKKCGFAQEDKC